MNFKLFLTGAGNPVDNNIMKQLELKVIPRNETGRGPNRRLRGLGKIPAVIYGKKGSQPLIIEQTDFRVLWKAIAGVTALIQVDVEGKESALSIIKEVQRNARTDEFLHIDFHEVSSSERMHTNVAVHILGESVGVKNEGALLEVSSHELEIRCLPSDLPSTIDIDISELHTGDSIHIKDLKVIEGVEFIADPDQLVIACVAAAVQEAVVAKPEDHVGGEDLDDGKESEDSGDKGETDKSES